VGRPDWADATVAVADAEFGDLRTGATTPERSDVRELSAVPKLPVVPQPRGEV
jgi:hypothetical protein